MQWRAAWLVVLGYLRARWRSLVITVALLSLLINALSWVDRCGCPQFLDYPGHGVLAGLVTLYLALAYLLFFAMVGAKLLLANTDGAPSGCAAAGELAPSWWRDLVRFLDRHDVAISLGIAVILLPIFDRNYTIRLIYNLSIALAYGLLMFRIVLFMRWKMAASGHLLSFAGQKVYIAYGLGILLLISFIPTVEGSDPFGTQFQLQVLCALLSLHLAISWALAQWRLAKQLQGERVASELALLKTQINPHFLFNTLNNLYGLAKEQSPATPDLILCLSGLLRHTVYQGGQDSVRLADEIAYLNDYIALQQIRYTKQVDISFECKVDRDDYRIAPLLLIVLLENAYKHGVEPLATDACVRLQLDVSNDQLHFEIENSCDPTSVAAAHSSGVGLQNLQRRLELEYPQRHRLRNTSTEGCYQVRLDLSLPNEGRMH